MAAAAAATELVQIDPPELTFVFELKKQSSCLLHLSNMTPHSVAFKVKTTSPKKYCVRPTIGIISPHGSSQFTVTMQAQHAPPPDFHCKDKFLIQTTIVPSGTAQDHISSDLFAKHGGNYVQEKKLRVVLVTPPSSPALLPVNGDFKTQDSPNQIHVQKDRLTVGLENMPPPLTVAEEKTLETDQNMEEDREDKDIVSRCDETVCGVKQPNEPVQLSLAKDFEELKSKLSAVDSKLREAEGTIMKLNEERRTNAREKYLLKQELELLKRKINMKRAQDGFPLLFVCMVALVSVGVGYYVHP